MVSYELRKRAGCCVGTLQDRDFSAGVPIAFCKLDASVFVSLSEQLMKVRQESDFECAIADSAFAALPPFSTTYLPKTDLH